MKSVSRKRGMNRGRPRLWLEGKLLIEAGFRRGDHFSVTVQDDGLILVKKDDGSRKVSGKAEKPIIDIMGATLGPLQEVERVTVSYEEGAGQLTITPEIAE